MPIADDPGCLCAREATGAFAQESGISVRSVRVLPTTLKRSPRFTRRPSGCPRRRVGDTPAFKEIIINSGTTPDLAKKATTTAIVIATRPADAPAGAMASLILEVPNLDKAIEAA